MKPLPFRIFIISDSQAIKQSLPLQDQVINERSLDAVVPEPVHGEGGEWDGQDGDEEEHDEALNTNTLVLVLVTLPSHARAGPLVELQTKVREDITITEKASTRASCWLKVPTSAFTFKTLC